MKIVISALLLFGFMQAFNAQENSGPRIKSSNLGGGGSSKTVVTSKGTYYISQSIGQSSVIGTHYNNGYYLRQGYQQPETRTKSIRELEINFKAKVYPNPFNQTLNIDFKDLIRDDISVSLFNVEARLIYSEIFQAAQNLKLQIHDISTGTYFLKVTSGSKQFNTKLIKI